MRATLGLGLAVAVGMMGCLSETPQQMQTRMDRESAALRQTLDGFARSYERWVAAGQADSIAGLYMEQGRQLPPNEPAAVGRAAIRDREARLARWGAWTLRVIPEALVANGPLAVERGSFAITLKPGPNAPPGMPAVADTGKYLAHWHEVNGQWRFAELIWNSNRSPTPPRAAPKTSPKSPRSRQRSR